MNARRLAVWLVIGILIDALLTFAFWVVPPFTSINELLLSETGAATKYSLLFFHDALLTLCVYLCALITLQLLVTKTRHTLTRADVIVVQLPIALSGLYHFNSSLFRTVEAETAEVVYSVGLYILQAVGLFLLWLVISRLLHIGKKPRLV